MTSATRGRTRRLAALVFALVAVGCATTGTTTPPTANGTNDANAAAATGGNGASARRAASASTAKIPTVTGPVIGGTYGVPFNTLPADLAQKYGYSEQEFFVHGDATAYAPQGTLGEDGKWTVAPSTSAPYVTRIVARRPVDPGKFNGTVVVEWLNVTSGMDADPDFGFAHDELMRDGFAYVGVSAQIVGIEGGGVSIPIPIPGLDIKALKPWDAQRYGALVHPGDAYSYDIFSQAGQAAANATALKPLGDLRPQYVIAAGESQSASRMVTYVNAVQPLSRAFDGFLIHSRGPSGSDFGPDPGLAVPKLGHVRDDVGVPVMQLETETDLFGLRYFPARQPDTDHLVTWELAGTAHADLDTIEYGVRSGHVWNPSQEVDFTPLCGHVNDAPQTYLVRAAFDGLDRWVKGGPPPAAGEPLQVVDGHLARDADGNVLGGVRSPVVDVPTQTLTGEADRTKSVICTLFGQATPYPADQLASLYPTHQTYVDQVTAATQRAVDAGHVLTADQPEIVAAANAAPVPS